MFKDFKFSLILGILYTIMCGIFIGVFFSFINFNQPFFTIFGWGGFSLIYLCILILYWKKIFYKMNLQDKLNSVCMQDID